MPTPDNDRKDQSTRKKNTAGSGITNGSGFHRAVTSIPPGPATPDQPSTADSQQNLGFRPSRPTVPKAATGAEYTVGAPRGEQLDTLNTQLDRLNRDIPRADPQRAGNAQSESGFRESIPGQFVGALMGDNPIPGTGGLYQAVNDRGPKIVESAKAGNFSNAAGQVAGIVTDTARNTAANAMEVSGQTIPVALDLAGDFASGFVGGLKGETGVKQDQSSGQTDGAQAVKQPSQTGAQASSASTRKQQATPAPKTQPATVATSRPAESEAQEQQPNGITMTTTADGRKSFSGINVDGDATVNGQPINNATVVSSEGMSRATGYDEPEETRQSQPPLDPQQLMALYAQNAPVGGFKPQQNYQPTPQSEFEQRVAREIFRQATRAMPGAQNGQLTASQRSSLDKLASNMMTDRNNRDIQAMRNESAMNQTAMTQQGMNQRAMAKLGLDTAKFASDEYAKGFDLRNKERLEGLRKAYETAETPEQRSAIAEQIRILNGNAQNAKDRYVMVDQVYGEPGMETTARVAVDPVTGQVIGGRAKPTEANVNALRKNPSLAPLFDAQFGQGAAAQYLGGQ